LPPPVGARKGLPYRAVAVPLSNHPNEPLRDHGRFKAPLPQLLAPEAMILAPVVIVIDAVIRKTVAS
jgi:hypothetical protein